MIGFQKCARKDVIQKKTNCLGDVKLTNMLYDLSTFGFKIFVLKLCRMNNLLESFIAWELMHDSNE